MSVRAQRHWIAKMKCVTSCDGLLPERVHMAFIDVGFLNQVEGILAPEQVVEVVLDAVDVASGVRD